MPVLRYALFVAAVLSIAGPVEAHHEAIFGPQSSAVLSADRFASAQVFTRETGPASDRKRQTTTVFSAGMQPFKRPLSVALVVPVSFVGSTSTAAARTGVEDALISARYRVEPAAFTEALGLDESYFMGVGGVELPSGTFDHDFGKGALGAIAAGLVNVEKRPFSAIGYAYYHHAGVYKGTRESRNVFVGAGAAWTPIDDLQTGKLVSFQVGLSHERTFAQEQNFSSLPNSGGSGVFLHQGVVWGANEHVQLFGLLSIPVSQEWRSIEDQQRFRLGAGAIFILGG